VNSPEAISNKKAMVQSRGFFVLFLGAEYTNEEPAARASPRWFCCSRFSSFI
jgi:hypothetical protein